ncbi:class I SAM-dependent methyltransferase [Cellvibrio polysaccharolyticus]|nr:class I SAM-dependent methyltransferase [Cellvibrio polysaccharolyticus]
MPPDNNQKNLTKTSRAKSSQAIVVKKTEPQIISVDSVFSQQLKLHWQLGDWSALERLSDQNIEARDNRAECAVYITAACFQLGLLEKAAFFKSLAIQWGASRKDLSRVLISGVYNNLALAFTLVLDKPNKALQHFITAAQVAMPGVAMSAIIKARTDHQLSLLRSHSSVDVKTLIPTAFSPNYQSIIEPETLDAEVISHHYFFDKAIKVWRRTAQYDFTYNDGDEIEQRLLSALKLCDDVSVLSKELLAHQIDWASEYHLSSDRANLLRPFSDIFKNANVLELGCGCGAITRYLGESGASVIAVEGSQQRATIAAERCRELTNVSVILDKIEQIPFSKQFDVVTLIGVLEYSRIYVDAEDPIQHILEKARSYLKPNGVLIVAIENQLGLKYFAGAPEDHGVGVMAGINDLYQADTAVTFGKQELERRFLKAGFSKSDTYLAFPDYKLPCLMVHPGGYNDPTKFDLSNLLSGTVFYDRQGISNPLFSLENCWPLIYRNGLLADMANSHLFLVHNEEVLTTPSNTLLASYYSPKRAGDTAQSLIFYKDGNDIRIKRTNVNRNSTDQQLSQDEKYVSGTLHSQLLNRIVQKPGWTLIDIKRWLQQWLDALDKVVVTSTSVPQGWPSCDKWLPEHYIDAIPRNLIISENGHATFIDLEWTQNHILPMSLVLYRGLAITLGTTTSIAMPADPEMIQRQKVLNILMEYCGYSLTAEEYRLFIPFMEKLSRKASGIENEKPYSTQELVIPPFTVRKTIGVYQDNSVCLTLYWRGKDDASFCEENSIKHLYSANGTRQTISIGISKQDNTYSRFRLDIADRPGCYKVTKLAFSDSDDVVLWQWDFNLSQLTNIGGLSFYKSQSTTDDICLMGEDHDPQFELEIPEHVLDKLTFGSNMLLEVTAYCENK